MHSAEARLSPAGDGKPSLPPAGSPRPARRRLGQPSQSCELTATHPGQSPDPRPTCAHAPARTTSPAPPRDQPRAPDRTSPAPRQDHRGQAHPRQNQASPQNRTSPAPPQNKARAPRRASPAFPRNQARIPTRRPEGRHAGIRGSSPGNTEARQRRAKIRATPGGYGGKPPGVAIIGVPTGARNAGSGALTGDQSTDMNATRKHPLVCQDPIATRSREGG